MDPTTGGTYRFDPRGVRADREEAERFEASLDRSLRVAFAWNQGLRLRWRSGRSPGVRLIVDDRAGVRWVEQVLSGAYPRSEWARSGPPEPAVPPSRVSFESRVCHHPDLPLSEPDLRGGTRWCETVLAGLAATRADVLVEWEVSPLGIPGGPPVDPPSPVVQPVPVGFRALPPSETERSARDTADRGRWDPQWELRGRLVLAPTVALSQRERIAALIESATAAPGRARVTFREVRALWPRPPRAVRVSTTEVRSLFPTPWTRQRRALGPVTSSTLGVLPLGGTGPGVGIPVEAHQGRHLLVLGETGMGKSTLLVSLARRASRFGTVVFVDPIGDSARRFAQALDPRDWARATVIAPVASPVGVNALYAASRREDRSSGGTERVRDDLVAALRRVRSARYEESSFWGPRLEETASAAIEAASYVPGGTLVDALEILERSGRRAGPVPPEARDAVERLRARVAERPEEVDGTRRLLAEVTRNSHLRQLLCEPRARWSPSETVSPGRFVILSGEAPVAGETVARTLLSVHLALLWAELIARTSSGKVFLVLDEVQWYAHEGLGEMLRLGRRFNVHVWAATQSLSRLPVPLRDALLTNSADVVLFRGSPDEARDFSRWTGEVRPEELTNLGRGRAVVLMDKGREVAWIDAPLGPEGAPGQGGWAECIENSVGWVIDPVPPDSRGPTQEPASPNGPVVDPLRELLLVVWAGLLSVEPQSFVEVPLESLRRVADPTGRRVRELGRRLADAGVRVESRRSEEGNRWKIRRGGFDVLLGNAVGPSELSRAADTWRLVVGGPADGPRPPKDFRTEHP